MTSDSEATPDLTVRDGTYSWLLNNRYASDVKVVFVDEKSVGKFIHAHSQILAARSCVFVERFAEKLNGEITVIFLDSVNHNDFMEFLRFLYAEECELLPGNVWQILELSRIYEVEDLEKRCMLFMEANLNGEIALYLLEKGIAANDEVLKHKTLQEIGRCYSTVLQLDKFKEISHDALELILGNDTVDACIELMIFEAVMKWAEHNCLKLNQECTGPNKRSLLTDRVIKLIRFPTMRLIDFKECIAREKDLLTQDEIENIEKHLLGNVSEKINFHVEKRQVVHTIENAADMATHVLRISSGVPCEKCNYSPKEFNFKVNRRIILTSFNIFVVFCWSPVKFTIECKDDVDMSYSMMGKSSANSILDFKFKEQIVLFPNYNYVINFDWEDPAASFRCPKEPLNGIIQKECDVAVFEFQGIGQCLIQSIHFKIL